MTIKTFKNYLTEIAPGYTTVSGWGVPEGMSTGSKGIGTVSSPNDPDPNDGYHLPGQPNNSSRGPITSDELEQFKQEIEDYGGKFVLDRTTAQALKSFQGSRGWQAGNYTTGGVRWAIRPPITNKLAGGIGGSYHQTGQALDIKHRGQSSSVDVRAQILEDGIKAGFTGFGFGRSQTHFDTRSNGITIYVYGGFDLASAQVAMGRVIEKAGLQGEVSFQIRDLQPSQTGIGSPTMMSVSDARKLRRALLGPLPSIPTRRPPVDDPVKEPEQPTVVEPEETPTTQVTPTTPPVRPTPTTRPTTTYPNTPPPTVGPSVEDEELKDDLRRFDWRRVTNRINTPVALAVAAILIAGIWGARRLFRRNQSLTTNRRSTTEVDNLLSSPGSRAMLLSLRSKHKDLFDRAKRDRKARKEVEELIVRELTNIGSSSYY